MTKTQQNRLQKILLVDDDQHMLESLASWLRTQGFDTTMAYDQATAESELANSDFDLAFVD